MRLRIPVLVTGAMLFTASCGDDPEGYPTWPDGASYWVGWSSSPDTATAWSPTGNVALFCTPNTGSPCIFSYDASGAAPHQMTFSSLNESTGPTGCWDGDSGRIVYTAVRDDGTAEIRWIPGSSYSVHLVLYDSLPHMTPTWTPAGDTVLYCTLIDGRWGLWKIPAEPDSASSPVQFFTPGYDCVRPSYSPDGSTLMFQANETGDWDVMIMPADGGGEPTPAAGSAAQEVHPSWGPGDGWFVFASDLTGDFEIYAGKVGSDTLVRLTEDSGADLYPAWNPQNGYVIFSSDRASGAGGFDLFWTPEP